ncbi:acyltransferase family protein [Bacteroides sp. RTP21281st1_F3_RTP21281_210402]
MLYLHLFNQIGNVELCVTHLSVGNTPLVYLFTRCTNPVAFFLLLSGYGLYASYKLGKRDSMRRIGKLYVHYWLTLLIFVPLGWWIRGSEVYPGSWKQILENVSGWYTGYNGEIWFLFPYMLLVLTSVQLFRWMDKVKLIPFFLLAGSLTFLPMYWSIFGGILICTHIKGSIYWCFISIFFFLFC